MRDVSSKLVSVTLSFISLALIIYTLSLTRGFLIPFVIGIVIAYFIVTLHEAMQSLLENRLYLPKFVTITLAIVFLLSLLSGLFTIVTTNIAAFIQEAPSYQENLKRIMDHVLSLLPIKPDWNFLGLLDNINVVSLASQGALLLTDIASNAGMILLYVLFLLIEYNHFDEKLTALCGTDERRDKIDKMILNILAQIKKYLRVKTLISFLTALSSYILLVALGVSFPALWATLIFLFNYIPTIGSIIATLFPSLLTLVQFDSFAPFFIVSLGLTSLQFIFGNIIEPRAIGKSFNLSALVIILFLSIWYQIWGIIGMFLCIPIMVIISIILANFSQTRWIAILFSQSGSLEVEKD